MTDAKKLADEHWAYVGGLLELREGPINIRLVEYVYKTAFAHGWKHCQEEAAHAALPTNLRNA